jgi:hypothetical protein
VRLLTRRSAGLPSIFRGSYVTSLASILDWEQSNKIDTTTAREINLACIPYKSCCKVWCIATHAQYGGCLSLETCSASRMYGNELPLLWIEIYPQAVASWSSSHTTTNDDFIKVCVVFNLSRSHKWTVYFVSSWLRVTLRSFVACVAENFICLRQIPDCYIPQLKLEILQILSERENLNLLLVLTVVSKPDTTSLSLVCFQRLLIVSLLSNAVV